MADIALGGVGRIVEVALKIKEAVETVKQNEKECRGIQTCVARVTALLKRLDETTETMKDEVTRDTLDDLAKSLERALELVTECQRKHIFRRFLGAGDMAKELGRVQDDIVRKLQLGNFATIVQATIMLTNIHSAGAPRSPPPPPPEEVVPGFKRFSLSELKAATDDFSDENRIGSGGSGTVYKGVLHGGQVVAIKEIRGMLLCENQKRPYDEINVFLELKHKNIVRPLGYCHEITMVLTSYRGKYVGAKYQRFCYVEEYMPYGSMENIIKGSRRIDWSSRFRIIRGIAQGVHYLHEQRVVHLDLKPSNILFDSDMNPRIGDFGVANKMLDHGEDKITRDSIVGTVGYMAPEYLGEGILSTKCDVYAFGVTLLATVSSMCKSKQPDINALAGWASMAQEAGHTEDLFDSSLCDKSQLTEIKRCMKVGLLCVQYDRKERPTMADVLAMLNGEKELPIYIPSKLEEEETSSSIHIGSKEGPV